MHIAMLPRGKSIAIVYWEWLKSHKVGIGSWGGDRYSTLKFWIISSYGSDGYDMTLWTPFSIFRELPRLTSLFMSVITNICPYKMIKYSFFICKSNFIDNKKRHSPSTQGVHKRTLINFLTRCKIDWSAQGKFLQKIANCWLLHWKF